MPKEVTIKTLFQENKEKYLAIIFFTMQFANKKEWFREYHFRYALEKNPQLSPPYQKVLAKGFDNELKREYADLYSPIKKCFDSRSNLVDHLKNLVELKLLEKKTIDDKNHYRFDKSKVYELIHSYIYAWFNALPKKVPPEILGEMKDELVSKYGDKLIKYDAFFIRYRF